MAKKFTKEKKIILPWEDAQEEKFVNYIMMHGKKTIAKKIFDMVMKEIRNNGHMNPRIVLRAAIENASPNIMVKSARVGGSVYQVPVEVKTQRKFFFACKWMLDAAKSKKGKQMYKKLTEEILAAYSGQGVAVKKKEESQKMAEANRAFAYMAKYVH